MKDIVLIIGASSDIGLALIKEIKDECLILAHYRSSESSLLQVSKQVSNQLVAVQADLQKEAQVIEMIHHIEQNYGVPNKIIHLAAPKFENKRFKDAGWKVFQQEIDVSLKSLVLILSHFLPKLAGKKTGRVVTMLSSVTLNVPPKALSHYVTIKYALLGLMRSLASEYADKKITFNCVSPSMIDTKFVSLIDERMVKMIAASHPLKRNATVGEIVPVLLMLLSNQSEYINGVNIPVTGGNNF